MGSFALQQQQPPQQQQHWLGKDVDLKLEKIVGNFMLFDGGALPGTSMHGYTTFAKVPTHYNEPKVVEGLFPPMAAVKLGKGAAIGICMGALEDTVMKTLFAGVYFIKEQKFMEMHAVTAQTVAVTQYYSWYYIGKIYFCTYPGSWSKC